MFEGYDRGVIWRDGADLVVAALCEDPADWRGRRWGRLVRFPPLSPDPALGGAVNTRAVTTLFAEGGSVPALSRLGPVEDFDVLLALLPPSPDCELSGSWLTDERYLEHRTSRAIPSWREWTHGVDPGLLDSSRRVRLQRPIGRYLVPDGTRTYYLRDVPLSTPAHNASFENEMIRDAPGLGEQQTVTVSGVGVIAWAFTTDAAEPGMFDWPAGEYRCQLDVPAAGVDLAFGLRTIGTDFGHFSRIDGTLDADIETFEQSQGPFNGAGLHLATVTADPAAGAATDRFEILIACQRVSGHGNQTIALRFSADCFADGPWPGGAASPPSGVLLELAEVASLVELDVEVCPSVLSLTVEII